MSKQTKKETVKKLPMGKKRKYRDIHDDSDTEMIEGMTCEQREKMSKTTCFYAAGRCEYWRLLEG